MVLEHTAMIQLSVSDALHKVKADAIHSTRVESCDF